MFHVTLAAILAVGSAACFIGDYVRNNDSPNATELLWIAEQLAFTGLALVTLLVAV